MPADTVSLGYVLFSGDRLTQARELRGLQKKDLAHQVQLTPAAIGQYERGVTRPRPAVVGRLALALRVPTAFFAGDRPLFMATESQTHFRSLRSTLKRHRAIALARIELVAEVTTALERYVRLPVVAIESRADLPSEQPEAQALALREAWDLGLGPIAHTVRLAENHGAVVVRLWSETRQVDAFSGWLGERPYIVLSDNKGDYARSRFDLAHELGHLLQHHDARPGDATLEREADRFAAAFLMPPQTIVRELPRGLDWRAYLALKARWGVSIASLIRQARNQSVLSEASYKRAMVYMAKMGWRSHEPGPPQVVERPTMLAKASELVRSHRDPELAVLAADVRLSREDLLELLALKGSDERLVVSVKP